MPPPTRATITATIGELIHAFILFPDNRHLSSTRCIGVLKCDWKGRSIWWNSVKTVHHHLTEVPVKLTSLSLFIRYQWWTVGGVWEVVGDDSFALRKASYVFKTFPFCISFAIAWGVQSYIEMKKVTGKIAVSIDIPYICALGRSWQMLYLFMLAVFTTAIWYTFDAQVVQIKCRIGQIRFSVSSLQLSASTTSWYALISYMPALSYFQRASSIKTL